MPHEHPFPILNLNEACLALLQGGLVLYPTETLYALGCDAMNPDAVAAVFLLKRRSLALPLPVIVCSFAMVEQVAYVTGQARKLMEAFWPGPLTIVLPARKEVPDLLTGRLRRVAVRFSSHPAAQALCLATNGPLVASSANISGFPAAARKEELDLELLGSTAGLYDAGPAPAGGAPSTVVDVFEGKKGGGLRILRKGAVREQALKNAGFAVVDSL